MEDCSAIFVDIVGTVRPRWFLFENVKGLAQTKTELSYVKCTKCHELTITDLETRDKFIQSRSIKNWPMWCL